MSTEKQRDKILLVDDEQYILEAFQRQLHMRFDVETANNATKALDKFVTSGPFAVVVSDMHMPGITGVEFLSEVRKKWSDTTRIMLTGSRDQEVAAQAVNEGRIYRFLTKPCSTEDLTTALLEAIQQHKLITAERELLHNTLGGTIKVLTDILSVIDPVAFGEARQIRELVRRGCVEIQADQQWEIELGAMLCNIGLVSVPTELVKKYRNAEALSYAESKILERVPEIGANLLRNIPRLEGVADIVLFQNKNYDGTGFPEGAQASTEIPLGSRMIHIVRSIKQYESAGKGKHFTFREMLNKPLIYDTRLLNTFLKAFDADDEVEKQSEVAQTMEVDVAELQVGQLLVRDVETVAGKLLLTKGSFLNEAMIERLRNFSELIGLKEKVLVTNPKPEAA